MNIYNYGFWYGVWWTDKLGRRIDFYTKDLKQWRLYNKAIKEEDSDFLSFKSDNDIKVFWFYTD